MAVQIDLSVLSAPAGNKRKTVNVAGLGDFTLVARPVNETDRMRGLLAEDVGEHLASMLGVVIGWDGVNDSHDQPVPFSSVLFRGLIARYPDLAGQAIDFASEQFPKSDIDSKNPDTAASNPMSPSNSTGA